MLVALSIIPPSPRSTPNFFLGSCKMARAVSNKRTTGQKESNILGFSRRQTRKKARQSASVDDVYEFRPEKVRRSRVALRLTRGELAELGREDVGDSGDDKYQDNQPKPRLIGQNSDDEGLNSEDDEDIDSEVAFGESDEETFAGYGFARKVR
jgi:U3 small nucleolar RNA-associated protein 14